MTHVHGTVKSNGQNFSNALSEKRESMKLIFPLLYIGTLLEPGTPYRPYIHPFSLVSCKRLTSSVEVGGKETALPGLIEVNATQVNGSSGAWWGDKEEEEEEVQPNRRKQRYLSSLQAALGTAWFSRWMPLERSGAAVLSPLYLHMVLASLLLGAEGTTADKLHDVLGLSDSSCGETGDSQRSQDMHQQSLLLFRDILSHQRGSLSTGTWMVVQEGVRLRRSFVHGLRRFFPEVQLGGANFSQPRVVEESINRLAHRASGGRLDKLVAGLTPRTNMLVASFVHFKGRWKTRSQCHGTELRDFFNDAGDKVQVPMTIWCGQLQYKTAPEYTMIKLPLSETTYVMLIQPVQPAKMKNFERTLTTDRIRGDFQTGFVKLVMPRFVWEGTYNVKELFNQDPDILGGQANFSRISSAQRLVPEQVIQSIIFEVTEDDREQVIAEDLSVTNTTTEIRIDKPFFFRVYDGTLEMLLFLGRVKKLPLKPEFKIF
ncbi:angiotensinogen isoform X2 [Rhinoraja longicauda]